MLFFRNDDEAIAFCNQLKILDGIDILVDTMAVLEADSVKFDGESTDLNSESFNAPKALPQPSSSKLQRANIVEPTSEQTVMKQAQNHLPGQNQITMLASNMKANMKSNTKRLSRWVGVSSLNQTSELTTNTSSDNSKLLGSAKKTASNDYLDFHRNSNWTEKLRYERAQRTETWKKATISSAMTATGKFKMIDSVWSKNSEKIHRDLQYFARVIYGSTLSITIEKKDDLSEQTNFLLETVSARRMLEVPDDDSSLFLVKTVPRPLKPLRIWNDDQNQRNNFRIYSAFYEQPVTHPVTKRYNGGRLVRHCVVRFFLSDRSAIVSPSQSVSLFKAESARKICIAPYSSESTLTGKIRKEKNPCQKVLHRASSMSTVMMMGNLMEASDFVSTPRTGKAIEFVYKLAFFEKPTIEVLGKRFTVQDGNLKGAHRADASAIELSDASMTAAIILSGDDQEQVNVNDNSSISTTATPSLDLEVSEEKRIKPLNEHTSAQINTDCSIEHNKKRTENEILSVNIKVKNAGSDKKDLLRAFRPSFIRAILLVATARQEAQLQCLLWSIKSGSARQATKSRTEGLLQPTLALLQFANSKGRNKESILIRNLKFGSSHVEREKLRRSKILNPRYPTFLRGLNAKIEGWVKETSSDDGSVTFTYRIRCLALIESEFDDENIYVNNIIDNHDDTNEKSKSTDTGRKVYKEEWVITRSFREFMSLHKHLKTQMSTAAASGNATQRFAAATAAVFAAGSATNDNSHRKGLLLSLAHAAKIGALGATRKSLDKRTEILDEYLRHLLGPNNLLRRCSELMQFLGADTPLEFNHPRDFIDSLGRSETRRMEMNADLYPEIGASAQVLNNARSKRNETKIKASQKTATKEKNVDIQNQETTKQKSLNSVSDDNTTISSKNKKMKRDLKKLDQYAKLKKMIETVKLSDAREIIFEFIRYLFDLDNATFFRSRMVSALRTMSLVVTSSQEFNKVLLQMHIKYVNGKYIGSMVKSVYDSLWPNGVWYTAGPPMSEQEKKSLEARSKEALFKAFPEKVRTILGQEISEDGLSVLHEMLQNKVVMKSLGYMIMDTIWLEIFPELYDVLSGTEAVDDD